MKRSNALLPSEWNKLIQTIQITGVDIKRDDEILNSDKETASSNVREAKSNKLEFGTKSEYLCETKRIERLSID